ncbi:hypothetical protein ACFZCG_21995 [Streptomyces tanashiensis]|uniref:hypothetical protein n=1 Tax=Streptomyces tanashiensis TaxID=67367 RepID=UPI0036E6B203
MHLLMALPMAVLGVATALAAVAEAWRRAPALRWVPHLVMGAVMAGMHFSDPYLLWTGGAVLAAVAVLTGIRHGGLEGLRADSVDLAACAVLLGAAASRQSADGSSIHVEAHHLGHPSSGSGAALYAAAALIALMTFLAWSVARSVIHVRASRDAARPALGAMRTRRRKRRRAAPVRTVGLVMVPLMVGTVLWG